jgi:hypothetical protein
VHVKKLDVFENPAAVFIIGSRTCLAKIIAKDGCEKTSRRDAVLKISFHGALHVVRN